MFVENLFLMRQNIMKNSLFLFNPDHDMALANHDLNYMSPASARQLSSDLALFPAWYAGKENSVLAQSAYNLTFLQEMRVKFPQLASLLTEAEVAMTKDITFTPWGWDSAVYRRFIQLGVPPRALPTQRQLTTIREKSHRLRAVELLKRMQFEYCCGESFYMTELKEIREFVESRTSCVLKAPLSGSGKGLNWCKGIFTSHISDWCRNIIRQQGGVVAEPLYDKVTDFAMQFHADAGGQVRFAGYSLFYTNPSGAYEGNWLMADAEIEGRLTKYISLHALREVRESLEKNLSEMLNGIYVGYLGVDMMICRSYDVLSHRLHPCVEINLRMSMGMAARLFHDHFVQPGKKGVFNISYYATNDKLQEEHRTHTTEHPLELEDGKIVRGYISLVPVTPRARYSAWVIIGGSESVAE